MANIINNWCDEKLLEVLKIRSGRIYNLKWKPNFKDYIKRDTITNVINSQSL
jgi:hypothetical protein